MDNLWTSPGNEPQHPEHVLTTCGQACGNARNTQVKPCVQGVEETTAERSACRGKPVRRRVADAVSPFQATMTEQEQIAHTWIKHLLHSSGRMNEYAEWKLVTYARFCPEFSWVPIPETV